jgi:hypothetical protein
VNLNLLDTAFHQTSVIDVFISALWTERYNDAGDCTLIVSATPANRALFQEGMFLQLVGSQELMLIETISITDADDTLTMVATSLTGFLKNRIFRNTWATTQSSWHMNGDLGACANLLVDYMCVNTTLGLTGGNTVLPTGLGAAERITGLSIGPNPTAGETVYDTMVPYGNVFDAVKMLCDLGALGFAIYMNPPSIGGFTFTVYRGRDLTASQSVNPPVIFEQAIDTFTNVKQVRSIAGYKTHAYAWPSGLTAQSLIGSAVAPGASGLSSWQRRTLMVEATDVTATDYSNAVLTAILNQKAADALANNNYVIMADGQIVPQNSFVYGFDYSLGDIIELRGTSAIAQSARISEYIRAQDKAGERAYPTLSVIS